MTTTRLSSATLQTITDELITKADDAMAQYPQYRGKFDGWIAVPAERDVLHRGRVVLPAGACVLMDPSSVHTIARDDESAKRSARGQTFATFAVHDLYDQGDQFVGIVSLNVRDFAAAL